MKLIRLPEVLERTAMKKTSVYKLITEGALTDVVFTQHFRLSCHGMPDGMPEVRRV